MLRSLKSALITWGTKFIKRRIYRLRLKQGSNKSAGFKSYQHSSKRNAMVKFLKATDAHTPTHPPPKKSSKLVKFSCIFEFIRRTTHFRAKDKFVKSLEMTTATPVTQSPRLTQYILFYSQYASVIMLY